MSWGNAIVKKAQGAGSAVVSIDADLHLAGDVKKTKKKLTWLAGRPTSSTSSSSTSTSC